MFGRKGLAAAQPPRGQDGYEWVDRHLARYDQPGSVEMAHALGQRLFDSSYRAMQDERGVQIEAIVAMLSSVAGHLCLVAILNALVAEQLEPADIGMMVVTGQDGQNYYFGDAPNRLLCEAQLSFVSLAFGAAHQHGAAVSIAMIHEEMKHLAGLVGSPRFMAVDLPPPVAIGSPLAWASKCTPFVLQTAGKHFHEAVANIPMPLPAASDMRIPDFLMPRVLGFAVQMAIDVGHQALDPAILARIAMACAMRTAKIDPACIRGAN